MRRRKVRKADPTLFPNRIFMRLDPGGGTTDEPPFSEVALHLGDVGTCETVVVYKRVSAMRRVHRHTVTKLV